MATITGDNRANNLIGTGGADVITGHKDADTMRGHGGDDVFWLFPGDVAASDVRDGEVIDGGSGTDTLKLVGIIDLTEARIESVEKISFFDTIGTPENIATLNPDQLQEQPGDPLLIAEVVGSAVRDRLVIYMGSGSSIDLSALDLQNWSAEDQVEIKSEGNTPLEIIGSGRDDLVTLSDGDTTVRAGAGKDSVFAGEDDDTLDIATNDTRPGELYDGGEGYDILRVAGVVDLAGATLANLEAVAFRSIAGPSSVSLAASSFAPGGLSGPHGINRVDFVGSAGANTVRIVLDGATTFSGGKHQFLDWSSQDRVIIEGGDAAEDLAMSVAGDVVLGGSGDDTISGLAGSDTLYGGSGNDMLRANSDGHFSDAGIAADVLFGGAGDDTLVSEHYSFNSFKSDADTLYGGAGNDTIWVNYGNRGWSTYLGEAGDDNFVVNSESGQGLIDGGAGVDRLAINQDKAQPKILDADHFRSIEILDFRGNAFQTDRFSDPVEVQLEESALDGVSFARKLTIVGSGSFDEITINLDNDGFFSLRGSAVSNERIGFVEVKLNATNVDDVIVSGDLATVVKGAAGDDRLYGGEHFNRLDGGVGSDFLSAGLGDDYLFSGEPSRGTSNDIDTLRGGGGNDEFALGAGDRAYGEAGDDIFNTHVGAATALYDGGEGYDAIRFRAKVNAFGASFVRSIEEIETSQSDHFTSQVIKLSSAQFGPGRFSSHLNFKMDTFFNREIVETQIVVSLGNVGSFSGADFTFEHWHEVESFHGYRDEFSIIGSSGADSIVGTDVGDNLTGDAGADTLTGGDGDDSFIFLRGHSGVTLDSRDIITDFSGGDRIDVSAIDANAMLAGDQSFLLSTEGTPEIGQIGQLQQGKHLLLSFNVDSDAEAEMTLLVLRQTSVAAADFVL